MRCPRTVLLSAALLGLVVLSAMAGPADPLSTRLVGDAQPLLDTTPPEILHTQPFSLVEAEAGATTILAQISDSSGIASATLSWEDDTGPVETPMTSADGLTYTAEIPAQSPGARIGYSLHAVDASAAALETTLGPFFYDVLSNTWAIADLEATDGLYDRIELSWGLPVPPAPEPGREALPGRPCLNPEGDSGVGRALDAFRIYRNGIEIASTSGFSYVEDSTTGILPDINYIYTVTAVWSGAEAPFSNTDPGSFSLRPTGSSAPDAFGYLWENNYGPSRVSYDWFEIASIGDTLLHNIDSGSAWTQLPFNFFFYGLGYDSVRVSSHGFLCFDPLNSDNPGSNQYLPDGMEPDAMICAFWDQLDLSSGGTPRGTVLGYHDPVENRFVIQWQGAMRAPASPQHGPYTFQVLLHDDGRILFQYETMEDDLDSATVGIENGDGDDGLVCNYNNLGSTLVAGTAILITPPVPEAAPTLGIQRSAGNVLLSWNNVGAQSYTLFEASQPWGPWQPVVTLATLNWALPAGLGQRFYQVEASFGD